MSRQERGWQKRDEETREGVSVRDLESDSRSIW